MISKTQNGMKEGLAFLGLPNFPLSFVPGESLRLCGHDMREEVNGMIHAWMTNDKSDFYKSLLHIKEVVEKPMLTEEEYDLMEESKKADWVRTRAPDGTVMYAGKHDAAPAQDDDDDDDEVIDVTPAGARLEDAGSQPPATGQPAPAAAESQHPDEEDWYALLGVEPQASLQEIRLKFRSLMMFHHPEKGGDVNKFQQLNKAYAVLCDQKKRQEFDSQLASRRQNAGSGGYPTKAFVD